MRADFKMTLIFSGLKLETPMLLTRPWWTRDSIAAQVSLKEGSTAGPVSCELGLQAEWQMQASRCGASGSLEAGIHACECYRDAVLAGA